MQSKHDWKCFLITVASFQFLCNFLTQSFSLLVNFLSVLHWCVLCFLLLLQTSIFSSTVTNPSFGFNILSWKEISSAGFQSPQQIPLSSYQDDDFSAYTFLNNHISAFSLLLQMTRKFYAVYFFHCLWERDGIESAKILKEFLKGPTSSQLKISCFITVVISIIFLILLFWLVFKHRSKTSV